MISAKRKHPDDGGRVAAAGPIALVVGSDGRAPLTSEEKRLLLPTATDIVGFGMFKDLTYKKLADTQKGYCRWVLAQKDNASSHMHRLQVYLRGLQSEGYGNGDASPSKYVKVESTVSTGQNTPEWVQRLLARGEATEKVSPDAERSALAGLQGDTVRLLHDYQRQGIALGVKLGGRVMLGDEMGLGKSVQALGIAAFYRSDWPALVIVPSSLRFVWRSEIRRWLPNASTQTVSSTGEFFAVSRDFYVVSYDLVARHERFRTTATGADFRMVICDESHFLKAGESQRAGAVLPLVKRAQRAVLITGTPALNNAFELFPQLDALLPGSIPSDRDFGQRYCVTEKHWRFKEQEKFTGSVRESELSQVLGTVMVRRRKADVLSQLPRKVWRTIPLELTASAQEMASLGADSCGFARKYAGVGTLKAGPAAEYVTMLLEALPEEDKLLLFFHHEAVGNILQDKLRSAGSDDFLVRVDGKTAQAERERSVTRFQEDPQIRVALLSMTACGVGLSLTAASVVVFAELYSVPNVMAQAEDRAHRVGQVKSVDVHYLIAHGTVDDMILAISARKRVELQGLLTVKQTAGAQASEAAPVCSPRIVPRSPERLPASPWLPVKPAPSEGSNYRHEAVVSSARPLMRRLSNPSDDELVSQLVAMGFEASQAMAALQVAGSSLDAAIDLLTSGAMQGSSDNATSGAASSGASTSQSSKDVKATSSQPSSSSACDTSGDVALGQLVQMGFDASKAAMALAASGSDLAAAVDLLTSAEAAGSADTDSDVEVAYDPPTRAAEVSASQQPDSDVEVAFDPPPVQECQETQLQASDDSDVEVSFDAAT